MSAEMRRGADAFLIRGVFRGIFRESRVRGHRPPRGWRAGGPQACARARPRARWDRARRGRTQTRAFARAGIAAGIAPALRRDPRLGLRLGAEGLVHRAFDAGDLRAGLVPRAVHAGLAAARDAVELRLAAPARHRRLWDRARGGVERAPVVETRFERSRHANELFVLDERKPRNDQRLAQTASPFKVEDLASSWLWALGVATFRHET